MLFSVTDTEKSLSYSHEKAMKCWHSRFFAGRRESPKMWRSVVVFCWVTTGYGRQSSCLTAIFIYCREMRGKNRKILMFKKLLDNETIYQSETSFLSEGQKRDDSPTVFRVQALTWTRSIRVKSVVKANWSSRHINVIQRQLKLRVESAGFVPAVPEHTTKTADSK